MDRAYRSASKGITGLMVALGLGLLGLVPPTSPAEFICAAGDVACLIAAMNMANTNGEVNTISLEAGTYILTSIDNTTGGPTGLPSVTSPLTLRGAAAVRTIIERAANAPDFRLGHVASMGDLTLEGLTLRGGLIFSGIDLGGVGGLINEGTLTLVQTILSDNGGGGIWNQGICTLQDSTLARNYGTGIGGSSGGGLHNSGVATIINTTFIDNSTIGRFGGVGGGIGNSGTLTLINSTLTGNGPSFGGDGGGLYTAGGTTFILNSTLVGNHAGNGGGIDVARGTVVLQNTLLARNISTYEDPQRGPDCLGPVTSFGNNLIGDPSGCAIALLPSDHTGAPVLGAFINSGLPGQSYVPLHPASPAIDAGNDAACPTTDQLGQLRVGSCDIGATEFQPETVVIHLAVFADRLARLFVVAVSSAPPDAELVVTVSDCLVDVPMQRLGFRYILQRHVETCGNINGQSVTVTSTYGGAASATLR